MPVQKSKKSPSRRGMRRANNALSAATISIEKETGKMHLRHHIGKDGFYRGQRIIEHKVVAEEKES